MINLNALLEKEIISLIDGSKIGEIYDVEIDEFTGRTEEIFEIYDISYTIYRRILYNKIDDISQKE